MKTSPQSAAAATLAERGWALLRGVVDSDELVSLRRDFDGLLDRADPRMPPVVQLPGAFKRAPALTNWLHAGRLGAIGRDLLGCPEVRLLQDVLLLKPAGALGEIPWHQDAIYTGFLDPSRVVSIRLALDPEDAESGGLEVLDGSHGWQTAHEMRHGGEMLEDGLSALPAALQARAAEDLRRVDLAPGDLSAHLGRTWHRSAPNRSDRARRTLVTHLFDASCSVIEERLPEAARAHFERDGAGRLTGPAFPLLG